MVLDRGMDNRGRGEEVVPRFNLSTFGCAFNCQFLTVCLTEFCKTQLFVQYYLFLPSEGHHHVQLLYEERYDNQFAMSCIA